MFSLVIAPARIGFSRWACYSLAQHPGGLDHLARIERSWG